jgi:decaprenylphospho-beta-D-erythro-pentofuranosid-2-ulose 2-reductase
MPGAGDQSERGEPRPPPQRVLIAGANSAIAQEMARVYARRGARLFLIGRDPAKLDALCGELGDAVVGRRAADLADVAGAEELMAEAWAALGEVDVACIAHGLLGDQLATERAYAAAELVIRTNYLSPVALLIPIANRMEAAGRGSIVVLASVAGDRGRPRNYTYGAAKGALALYLQGLRTRLYAKGVRVHTIKLGPVDTPMTVGHRKHVLFAQPAPVARRILAAVDDRCAVAYVPRFWRPILFVVRALPEFLFQRLAFLSRR